MALNRKVKRDKYDTTFAKFIKLRDKVCQKCGKADGQLECSHIFSRRHQGTRLDPANAKLLCHHHHIDWWHANPIEAVEWLRSVIGADAYDRLRLKANKPTKLTTWEKDEIRKEQQELIRKMEKEGLEIPCFNPEWNLTKKLL